MKFLGRHLAETSGQVSGSTVVLRPGTQVGTPDGLGVVSSIELCLLSTGDHTELDAPKVLVVLSGETTPRPYCLCKLELASRAAQDTLRSEFHRLWPPLANEVEASVPAVLAQALAEVMGRACPKRPVHAATLLRKQKRPRLLLRSAATAAVLTAPSQRTSIEYMEQHLWALLRAERI